MSAAADTLRTATVAFPSRAWFQQLADLMNANRARQEQLGYVDCIAQFTVLDGGAHGGPVAFRLTACDADEAAGRQGRSSYDHAAFRARDLDACERRLQQLGLPYQKSQVPGGGAVQLFLHDPAGLGVELNFAPGAERC